MEKTVCRNCGSLIIGRRLLAKIRAARPLDPGDRSPIACAIRRRWPNSHPGYWEDVRRRFTDLFARLPEEDAVKAIMMGFSSPFTAMRAGVIRRRRYIGYPEDRK